MDKNEERDELRICVFEGFIEDGDEKLVVLQDSSSMYYFKRKLNQKNFGYSTDFKDMVEYLKHNYAISNINHYYFPEEEDDEGQLFQSIVYYFSVCCCRNGSITSRTDGRIIFTKIFFRERRRRS